MPLMAEVVIEISLGGLSYNVDRHRPYWHSYDGNFSPVDLLGGEKSVKSGRSMSLIVEDVSLTAKA